MPEGLTVTSHATAIFVELVIALAVFGALVLAYGAARSWRVWCETTDNEGEF